MTERYKYCVPTNLHTWELEISTYRLVSVWKRSFPSEVLACKEIQIHFHSTFEPIKSLKWQQFYYVQICSHIHLNVKVLFILPHMTCYGTYRYRYLPTWFHISKLTKSITWAR